ncbi:MAG: cysteine desulfurase [Candidatus Liptonbacteria bacterium]|nr:cysteine desulfurase [Candidatus Liptonbacteria bacterium]
MKRIYLDFAATTPLDPAVGRAMEPYLYEEFGNPSSLHSFGQKAIAAIDKAREMFARELNANFREIIFTGSATEANNLGFRGVIKGIRKQELGIRQKKFTPRIIISAIEHESIRETAKDLEREGVEVIEIPVSREGLVDVQKLKNALNERTVLVSVMYANNEIGTVQPISAIGKIITDFRKQIADSKEPRAPLAIGHWPIFHTDAAQAFQFLDCDVQFLGVDLMTLSAHKIYGPKGVGALYMRRIVNSELRSVNNSQLPTPTSQFLSPVITGGGQEFGLRSGTENVAEIVGFGHAARRAGELRVREGARLGGLCEKLWKGIIKKYPRATLNGVSAKRFTRHSSLALPNILSVRFSDLEAEALLVRLDIMGLAASAGPACSSRSLEVSNVLQAIGLTPKQARETIRFSLGRTTKEKDVAHALSLLTQVFRR